MIVAIIECEYEPTEHTLRLIKDSLTGWYNQTKAAYNNTIMLIWENPRGLTPQEVFDVIGKDGALLLAYLNSVVKSLNDIGIEEKPFADPVPNDKETKANPDGTVTVSVKVI